MTRIGRWARAGATGTLILTVAASCAADAEEPPQAACAPGAVVLFVDHSASTRGAVLPAEVTDSLNRLPGRYLNCPGDRLHTFLVHRRTRGRAVRLDVTNEIPAFAARAGSRADLVADSIAHSRHRAQFERAVSGELSAFVVAEPRTDTSDSTDIIGSIEVASDVLGDLPPGAPRRIVYLSDMYESMSGPGRRDFDAHPPRSIEEARRWADEDSVNVLPQLRISPETLRGTRIRVLSRSWGDRQGSEFVREYWYRLFEKVGIQRPDIRFY